jgi:hypothetical protein
VPDGLGDLAREEEEELRRMLFERPKRWKVFVSSKMSGGVFRRERVAAAQAIEGTDLADAWYWERDAKAGPYSSEPVCVGQAKYSDGLVLLLGDELTPITRKEYAAASGQGAPCYILLKDGVTRTRDAEDFVASERDEAITAPFGNLSELQTVLTDAIRHFAIQAGRRDIYRRRRRRASREGPSLWLPPGFRREEA